MQQRRSGRATGATAAVLAMLVVSSVTLPASAQDDTTPEAPTEAGEPTGPEVAAATARLEHARGALASRVGRSAAAEARRARADTALVDTHLRRLDTAAQLERVLVLMEEAEAGVLAATEALDRQEDEFSRRVTTSYKYQGASASLVFQLLQGVDEAHEVARSLHQLDAVLGHDFSKLEERRRAVTSAQARLDRLVRLRGHAFQALQAAEAAIQPAREALDAALAEARGYERSLLDAASAALDAEQALLDAGGDLADLAPLVTDPLAPGTAAVDEEAGPTLDQRREWLADRRATVDAEGRIGAADWDARVAAVCPVARAEFVDDFHYPRSHGRRHLGTDLFAPRGAPVRAMVDGVVESIDEVDAFDGDQDLGGISVSLVADRDRHYLAHLDDVAPHLEVGDQVAAGDIVGFVGDSGNAAGTAPHLHLGLYVDGVAVNPYLTLAVVCEQS